MSEFVVIGFAMAVGAFLGVIVGYVLRMNDEIKESTAKAKADLDRMFLKAEIKSDIMSELKKVNKK